MSFSDDFPDADIMRELGDPMTYTPLNGTPKPNTLAILSFVPAEVAGMPVSKQPEIAVLRADAPAIGRGDTFLFKGKTYTVMSINSDDGEWVTVVAK